MTTANKQKAKKEAGQSKIDLPPLEIASVQPKRVVIGTFVLGILAPDGTVKVDRLAQRMNEVLTAQDVRVAWPTKHAELRVSRLNDSVTWDEVVLTLASVGDCTEGEIKVREIRLSSFCLGSV